MNRTVIVDDKLLIDGRPFILLGGEVQYFHLTRSVWRDRLKKAVDGGLNTVSSYMPWYWHEPEEGQFDLDGHTRPERSLRLFMDLVAETGLKLIARPGPFVNSELRCGGFPEWLFRDYPETLSRRSDGQIATGRPIPAEGEPIYRRFVRQWYRRIVPLLAEYDIHNGGPVILFQPDNELSAAWSFGLLNSLYDPEILREIWPAWLRNKYGADVAVLDERYGHTHRSFTGIEPPRALPAGPGERNRCLDWMDFKRWFFADWGATLADWAREDGIKVPVIFNEPVAGYYGHGDHAGFGAVLKRRGQVGFTACHTYADRIFDLDGISSSVIGMELVKSSSWGGPAMSVEINVAWHVPRLCRSEINWDILTRLGLGHGLSGFAVFPYAAGRGAVDDTIDGPEYYEQTCLDLDGQPTASWHSYKRFSEYVRGWETELTAASAAADIAVAYTPGQRQLDFLGMPVRTDGADLQPSATAVPGGELFDAEPALNRGQGVSGHDWLDGYEGVSKQTVAAPGGVWWKTRESTILLNRLNLSWDMLDLVNPNRQPGRGWIVVPCTGSLEREAVEYLLRHLDSGGGCLFFPTIPVCDLTGRPDTRLADRLQVKLMEQVRPAGGRVCDYGTRVVACDGGDTCGVNGWIWLHAFPAGSRGLASYLGRPVIGLVPTERGRAVVAGIDLYFTSSASLRLWAYVLSEVMGIESSITVEGNWLHGLLRHGSSGVSFLTLMNIAGRNGLSRVRIRRRECADIGFEVELRPQEARLLAIGVRLGGGVSLRHTTSEIIPTASDRRRFQLHGSPGTRGELAFDQPVFGRLDGRPVASELCGNVHVIRYRHPLDPAIFEMDSGNGR